MDELAKGRKGGETKEGKKEGRNQQRNIKQGMVSQALGKLDC